EFQPPRQIGRTAEEFLVEVVTDPPDRLGRDDPRGDRVGNRGQGDPFAAASDPRTDTTQCDGTPDPEPPVINLENIQRVVSRTEIELIIGDDVIEPPADQAEQHGDHSNVGDGTLRAATRYPPPFPPPDRHDDPDNDAQCIGADRQRPQLPHHSNGACDVREKCRRVHSVHRHYGSPWTTVDRRTPAARSSAVARTRAAPCSPAATSADPTMTPSAKEPTSAA